MPTKVLAGKKIEDEPEYCPNRYKLLQYKDFHCFQKMVQLFNLMQDYFPIRDSKGLVCRKTLLKEEILPHYQNSQFFRTYANSNKISGPLHIQINGCILWI